MTKSKLKSQSLEHNVKGFMIKLRWRKIKKKKQRLSNTAKKQGMRVSSLTTMQTWKCVLPLKPPVLRVPNVQLHCLSLFPEFCLWEENRWNPLEVNQAAGEGGLHGPLNKKVHECVLHVSFLCEWPVKISLCSSRVLESQAGPPCLLCAILTPNLKALCVLGSHSLSWTTPLDFLKANSG